MNQYEADAQSNHCNSGETSMVPRDNRTRIGSHDPVERQPKNEWTKSFPLGLLEARVAEGLKEETFKPL